MSRSRTWPQPALPPLERDPRYASLDVWRGLACLMVVIDHAGIGTLGSHELTASLSGLDWNLRWLAIQLTGLALGPPMFFAISGYCIAASVDSMRRKGKSAFAFEARRLWRTYPPYWIALGLIVGLLLLLDRAGLSRLYCGPIGLALESPSKLNPAQWLGNLTLTETWRPLVGGGYNLIFTRVAWTLCYQEQFYFVCFLAALLAPRRLYGVMAGITAAVVAVRVFAWDSGRIPLIDGAFPYYWHEFAVGLAVYWRLNVAAAERSRTAVDLGLAGLALLGVAAGLASTTAAAAFGLVMIAARPHDFHLALLPALAPVRACGRRCFSIYLTHLPVCSILGMVLYEAGFSSFWMRALIVLPAEVAASLAIGWAFFRLVERHFAPSRPASAIARAATAAARPSPEPKTRTVLAPAA